MPKPGALENYGRVLKTIENDRAQVHGICEYLQALHISRPCRLIGYQFEELLSTLAGLQNLVSLVLPTMVWGMLTRISEPVTSQRIQAFPASVPTLRFIFPWIAFDGKAVLILPKAEHFNKYPSVQSRVPTLQGDVGHQRWALYSGLKEKDFDGEVRRLLGTEILVDQYYEGCRF